jgi:heme/copper-type cytochrome/quinol oxidase subunit 3
MADLLIKKNKLGMLLFILSEAVFFSLLILAYAYFRNMQIQGPTAATSLDPLVTGIFSLFLFSSSFTMWRAEKSLQQENHTRLQMWLFLTIAFGIVFVLGQGIEWRSLIGQGTTISRNLFGTTFFTLTGFHGLHVIIGLLALAVVLAFSRAGDFRGPNSEAVETIAWYWHFVDIVWVVIFSVVYLTLVL